LDEEARILVETLSPTAVPHDPALEIRDEVGFFQEILAVLAKSISAGGG
jgi:hypothetical protein